MKKAIWILLFIFPLLFAVNLANAQDTDRADYGRKMFGFGVAMGKEPFVWFWDIENISFLDFPSFYMPIQVHRLFRIEPQFGYYKYNFSYGSGYPEIFSVLDTGIGAFYTWWFGPVDLYFGARFGWQFWKFYEKRNQDSDTEKRTDFYCSPTIGGEYFFTRNLSIGGEIQFQFINYGPWIENSEPDESDIKVWKSKTLFFVRWFFGRSKSD